MSNSAIFSNLPVIFTSHPNLSGPILLTIQRICFKLDISRCFATRRVLMGRLCDWKSIDGASFLNAQKVCSLFSNNCYCSFLIKFSNYMRPKTPPRTVDPINPSKLSCAHLTPLQVVLVVVIKQSHQSANTKLRRSNICNVFKTNLVAIIGYPSMLVSCSLANVLIKFSQAST